jgi:hypothetical protein
LRVGSSPIRVNDYIVIDPENVVPFSGLDGAISGPGKASLRLELPADRQPIGKGCDHAVGMIITIVIDNYNLPIEMVRYPQCDQRS